jgi:regulator of replication initiation timing
MTPEPGILLLSGLVIVLLVVIVLAVVFSPRGRRGATTGELDPPATVKQGIAPWVMEGRQLFTLWQERIERLDELKSRLAGMAEEIDRLRAEIGHIDEMRAQITRLGKESERCRVEQDHLREVLGRIARLAQEAAAKPSE